MIARYTSPEMGLVWSEQRRYEAWLQVETAAAEAMARAGIIPSEAAGDIRERGGYQREQLVISLGDGRPVHGLTYVAAPANRNYLGEAPVQEIADQIADAKGPSGHNIDYLHRLKESLDTMGVVDHHVDAIVAEVRRSDRS